MKKIWGTISPWVEVEGELTMGRYVANSEFIKALLTYTDFDEYHFYVFNDYFRKITLAFFEKEPSAVGKTIFVYLKKELPINLKTIEYYVFHQGGWYMDNPTILYLREKYAIKNFPVTGIIHSINDFNTLMQSAKYIQASPKKFDSIVSTSTAGKKALENYFCEASKYINKDYDSNIDIIPLAYPLEFDSIQVLPKDKSKERLELDKNKFTILYLGRLSLSTKLDLANMLYSLKDFVEQENIQLVLAGGASKTDQTNLENIIETIKFPKENIKIFYNFHHTLKSTLYTSADVFISPVDNLQETFGITVPEAKFFGAIPVVSDWNGYKDTVNDGKDGFRIPTYSFSDDELELDEMYEVIGLYDYHYAYSQTVFIDYNIMIDKIKTIKNDENLRKKMVMNCRGHARKFYSWKSVMSQYVELWDRLYLDSLNYKNSKKSYDNFGIKFRSIFKDYYEELSGEIKISNHWQEHFAVMSKMYLQYFYKQTEIENLLAKLKKGSMCFEKLGVEEKGVATLLLKWKVIELVKS